MNEALPGLVKVIKIEMKDLRNSLEIIKNEQGRLRRKEYSGKGDNVARNAQ